MKKLAFVIALLCVSAIAQTYHTPTLERDNIWAGSNTFKKVNGIRYASQFSGNDIGAQINAAIADCGGGCTVYVDTNGTISTSLVFAANTQIVFRPGTWHFTGSQSVNANRVEIIGAGNGVTNFYIDSATSDLFNVTAYGFVLKGVALLPNTTRTAGSMINASTSAAAGGYVEDVGIVDPYNFLTMSGGGGWILKNISCSSSGGNWNYIIRTYVASGTTAGFYVDHLLADIRTANQSESAIILDSRTDTVKMADIDILTANGTPHYAIETRDTDGVGGFPRWVRCSRCSVESPGTYGLYFDKGYDIEYNNSYVASSKNGAWIGAAARYVKIQGTHFVNINRDVVVTDTASKYWNLTGNSFSSVGIDAANTYDVFKVGANSTNFVVSSNSADNASGGIAFKYGIEILAGTSTSFHITDNDFSGAGTSVVQNGASGNNWTISNNHGYSNDLSWSAGGLNIKGSGTTTASVDAATGKGTFNGGLVSPTYQTTLSTPANSSATCTAGQMWADASFVYVCTASNTIKRAALSTF